MDLDEVMNRLREDLSHGPVDASAFVAGFYPYDIECGQLLTRGFDARRLRGRFRTKLTAFDGHISGIAENRS